MWAICLLLAERCPEAIISVHARSASTDCEDCVGVQSCQCVVDDFYYEYTACLNGTRTKRFRKLESRSSSVRAIA